MPLFAQNDFSEIHAQVRLLDGAGYELDTTGFEGLKMRLQVGAADEFSFSFPAQTFDGEWRPDMSIWQRGSIFDVEMRYDGDPWRLMQEFEVVSTTTKYPDGAVGEVMTVRAVSPLARSARNKNSRTFTENATDVEVVTAVADEYGWQVDISANGYTDVIASEIGRPARAKKAGNSDLTFLKRVAREDRLGGPRVRPVSNTSGSSGNVLTFPEPSVGELVFTRGIGQEGSRRLHSLSMNKDGAMNTRVAVLSRDPVTQEFVVKEFEVSQFGGAPTLVFEGPRSEKPINFNVGDLTEGNLALAVVEHQGTGTAERVEVISSATYETDLSAEDIAQRYFELRERFGKWANAVVDGHADLIPYVSIELEGNLAASDAGVWLPVWVEHTLDGSGWRCNCRVVRVVEEPPPVNAVE